MFKDILDENEKWLATVDALNADRKAKEAQELERLDDDKELEIKDYVYPPAPEAEAPAEEAAPEAEAPTEV